MTEMSPGESMKQGHAARQAGLPEEALGHFRRALTQHPDSAEANGAYGLMLLQLGRTPEAGPFLQKAEKILTKAVADEPQSPQAWEKLGELKARSLRFAEAESDFARAASLRPNDPSLLFKWARACFDNDCADEALRILGEAARLAPGHPAILRLYAEVFESRGAWPELERVALDWTRAHPGSAPAWRSLAKAQWETGYPQRALRSFTTSLDIGGRDANGLAILGNISLHALDLEGAAKTLDEAESLDPRNSVMLSAKAILMMWNGSYEEAQAYCRRSLAGNPGDAAAYRTLTQLANGRLSGDDLVALRAIADREDGRIQDRITALFALADCLDADERVDEAFACYERANRMAVERAKAEGLLYDPAATTRQTEELISIFATVPAAPTKHGVPGPIFILGMPRSGTTLVESVFGAHSKIAVGGEKTGIRQILPEFLAFARSGRVADISESQWAQWRAFYLQEARVPAGIEAMTDKNPWNFDALGLILGLFPAARIVHIRRNPVETGFSIFRHEFSKLIRFANRLEDIGHFYGEYARVMAHWERVAADRFTTIQYEDFVRQFNVAAPALLAACGLDWEEACGQFWKSKRAVSTISSMQVRRPPGKPATRAQAYAAHLQPLVAALQSSRVDLETGGALAEPR
jgi:tetratricopeptide (TPR) repeat protein